MAKVSALVHLKIKAVNYIKINIARDVENCRVAIPAVFLRNAGISHNVANIIIEEIREVNLFHKTNR